MINILYALGMEKMLLQILICDILHEKGMPIEQVQMWLFLKNHLRLVNRGCKNARIKLYKQAAKEHVININLKQCN